MKIYEYRLLENPTEDDLNNLAVQGFREKRTMIRSNESRFQPDLIVLMERKVEVWTPEDEGEKRKPWKYAIGGESSGAIQDERGYFLLINGKKMYVELINTEDGQDG